ncbi:MULTISPECIES: rod shape-determining protein RodA [Acinetobacter]|jgi:rod shape determining protein RodA|uniref:Peptidoglycan glycosyltransferase MrdB n=3 Tax=Acinetobacter TaxID=469 RepID=A0A1R7QCK6_ACIJO|nr:MULTISPECIES: rod shape-determining protein RodA [Acinetobacter]MDA0775999.1 rod shape-determining protein RodA [Pseudomonadota bacterium]OHC21432.1 MAG: rod shape-determining protein RodA [Pseudomonadales bacterium RIFCSPHIGHO2_12_FULL_40_16]ALV72625.1 rod shape-determining protein RodA [Acinetobacter johnsonii XBB1]AZN64390.1 rod shape-determining protein RodA [Acinetobacter johnsonii]ENU38876.1 rod shape-determining protein RodA [Acinetobacter johnsonii CIP 64.6]
MIPSQQYRFLRQSLRDGRSIKHDSSRWAKLHLDPWLLCFLILNAVLGLLVIYSASAQDMGMVFRQATSFAVGFIVMIICAQIPPKVYQAISPYFFIFAVILMVLVLVVGETRMGARRWISLPGIGSMQPSEFMKFAMPLMMAWYFAGRAFPPKFMHIVISLGIMMLPFLLAALQPDLNLGLLIPGVCVIFLSGISWRLIALACGALAVVAPLLWMFFLQEYQKKRVLTLFDPESDALGAGWNIIQSKIAIGSGGLMGKGFTEGTQSHLGYLPEHHTDFIMSTYAEEFGFIGVFLLFSLFAAIIIRCLIIGMNSFHNFGRLYAGAVGLTFFFFVLLNSGMVSGILPVTGDPLPLMSYGGTAVITMLASMGIVMSIHTHR